MAVLDESLKSIIGEKQYYSMLARMELQTLKESTYEDKSGKERKYTQKQALNKINKMLTQNDQEPFSLSWAKKHW